jgi:hypothetical protein
VSFGTLEDLLQLEEEYGEVQTRNILKNSRIDDVRTRLGLVPLWDISNRTFRCPSTTFRSPLTTKMSPLNTSSYATRFVRRGRWLGIYTKENSEQFRFSQVGRLLGVIRVFAARFSQRSSLLTFNLSAVLKPGRWLNDPSGDIGHNTAKCMDLCLGLWDNAGLHGCAERVLPLETFKNDRHPAAKSPQNGKG